MRPGTQLLQQPTVQGSQVSRGGPSLLQRITKPKWYFKQQEAAIHNAATPLYQLPNEILLMTGTHLSPYAKLLLRQTSQRLSHVFVPPAGFFPLNEHSPEIAELDKAQPVKPGMRIWCSACHTRHPASLFSADQRASPNSLRRRCVPMGGKVRLCAHHSFTYDEVQKGLTSRGFQCQDTSHAAPHWPESLRKCPKLWGSARVYAETAFSLASVSKGDIIDMAALKEVLATFDEPLCPHLSLCDPIIQNLVGMLVKERNSGLLKWWRKEERGCTHDRVGNPACLQWHHRLTDEVDFTPAQGAWISDAASMDCEMIDWGLPGSRPRVFGCACDIRVYMRRTPGTEVEEMIMTVDRHWDHTSATSEQWLDTVGYEWPEGHSVRKPRPRTGHGGSMHSQKPIWVNLEGKEESEWWNERGPEYEGFKKADLLA
ncbi:hypothetical protein BU16DRAFT_567347 [Lophium mytilinum]|uniref:F-box domain-containing protein n=1 Tax=Lophium mytilinum TaxID=390894 RepID=A0A6A6QAU0_9PEZI|nr:hypothetical protein BU16DRAFT_567347 [Lophium mytilinum]